MRRVTLRGLAQRKLRAFVTTLAVFLGVALHRGRLRADGHDQRLLRRHLRRGLRRHRRRRSARARAAPPTTARCRPSRPSSSSACAGWRAWRAPRAGSSRWASSWTRTATSSPPASPPTSSPRSRPSRSRRSSTSRAARRGDAGEASIDTSTADSEKLEIGDTLRIAGEREVAEYEIVGLQRLGDTDGGGAGTAALTLEEAQRLTGKEGELDAICDRRRRGGLRGRAQASRGPRAARSGQRGDRPGGGPAPVRRDRRGPRLLQGHPARVRRRDAVRGLVPDLQHLQHHGGAAHPRSWVCCARSGPPEPRCWARWSPRPR